MRLSARLRNAAGHAWLGMARFSSATRAWRCRRRPRLHAAGMLLMPSRPPAGEQPAAADAAASSENLLSHALSWKAPMAACRAACTTCNLAGYAAECLTHLNCFHILSYNDQMLLSSQSQQAMGVKQHLKVQGEVACGRVQHQVQQR